MECEETVGQLPVTYQRVLAWLDEGRSHEDIAARLGIEPDAVDPLVQLAQAKLARLIAPPAPATSMADDLASDGRGS